MVLFFFFFLLFFSLFLTAIDETLEKSGSSELDERLVERLIDGMLYAFQEVGSENDKAILNGFGTIVNALGTRITAYLAKICGTIKWRLHNKSAAVRMQAADLASRIALVVMQCGKKERMKYIYFFCLFFLFFFSFLD